MSTPSDRSARPGADSVRSCQRHIYDALVSAMSRRGHDLSWIEHERQAVAIAANSWAGAHPGTRTVSVEDVERVETMAVGHIDYGPKLALYVAELVTAGRPNPDPGA